MKQNLFIGAALAICLATSGCATFVPVSTSGNIGSAYQTKSKSVTRIETGTVTKVEILQAENSSPISLGSIIGGALGGILGHQFGGGRGKTAMTIAGAVGGAVAGNAVQKAVEPERVAVTIRTDSGAELIAVQPADNQVLRLGDRVRIEGNVITRIDVKKGSAA